MNILVMKDEQSCHFDLRYFVLRDNFFNSIYTSAMACRNSL